MSGNSPYPKIKPPNTNGPPHKGHALAILRVAWISLHTAPGCNFEHVAMGQNPVPPVNIPIPTKIGSKMGGAPIRIDPQPFLLHLEIDPRAFGSPTSRQGGSAACSMPSGKLQGKPRPDETQLHQEKTEKTEICVGTSQ